MIWTKKVATLLVGLSVIGAVVGCGGTQEKAKPAAKQESKIFRCRNIQIILGSSLANGRYCRMDIWYYLKYILCQII